LGNAAERPIRAIGSPSFVSDLLIDGPDKLSGEGKLALFIMPDR